MDGNPENGLEFVLELMLIITILQMGDQSVEVTEEKMDEAQLSKGKAVEAMAEGKHVGNRLVNDVFVRGILPC